MNTGEKMVRTFIALRIPHPAAVVYLADVAKELRTRLGKSIPFKPELYPHITLRFMGEITQGHLNGIRSRQLFQWRKIMKHKQFDLQFDGLGAFPGLDTPRVVWAGVGGDLTALRALQVDIDQMVTADGFPPMDDLPFTPHITIGRIGLDNLTDSELKKTRESLTRIHRNPPRFWGDSTWTVSAVELMASTKGHLGHEYIPVLAHFLIERD